MDCGHVRTCRNTETELFGQKKTMFVSEKLQTLYGK